MEDNQMPQSTIISSNHCEWCAGTRVLLLNRSQALCPKCAPTQAPRSSPGHNDQAAIVHSLAAREAQRAA
jgi:hypothetical protein